MKVSVIIPAHNEEKTIAAAIRAVLVQDYPDFEVIVVDNNSTDRTSEIASAYPVKLVHETNKGTMWACERGRAEATGDILARLDADCLPGKHWLSTALKHFENSKVIAVSGPYDYYDGGFLFRSVSLILQQTVYVGVNYVLQLFKSGATMNGGNSFFRASALQKIGGFNTKITFYGDETDTSKRLSGLGKTVFDPKLCIRTSARRFQKEGTAKIALLYWYHFFKGVLR